MKYCTLLLLLLFFSCGTSKKNNAGLETVIPIDSFSIRPTEEREAQNLFLIGTDSAATFSLQKKQINIYHKNKSKEYTIIDSLTINSKHKDFITFRKLSNELYAVIYRDEKKILLFNRSFHCVDSILVDYKFKDSEFKYGLGNHMNHPVELLDDSLLFFSIYPDSPLDTTYFKVSPFLFCNLKTKKIENYKFFSFPEQVINNHPSNKTPLTRVIGNSIYATHPHGDSITIFDYSTKERKMSSLENAYYINLDTAFFTENDDYEVALMNYWHNSFTNCYIDNYKNQLIIMFHTPFQHFNALQTLGIMCVKGGKRKYTILQHEFYNPAYYFTHKGQLYLPLYKKSLNVKKNIKYYIYSLDDIIM